MNIEPRSEVAALRLVMAQSNLQVGNITVNTELAVQAAERARDEYQADLIIFPELTLTGYPPEDLLLRPGFQAQVDAALEEILKRVDGIYVLLGHPEQVPEGRFNCASLLYNGQVLVRCRKHHLPNYGVFDEKRYFVPGEGFAVADVAGVPLGITLCEDIWMPEPAQAAASAGARLIVNLNASPFHTGKRDEREAEVIQRALETACPVVYVNLVGGQDELVFDGGSFVVDATGQVCVRAPALETGLYAVDFSIVDQVVQPLPGMLAASGDELANIYRTLVLGVRDYIGKNGFQGAIIGLSGGVDSALTLAIAVDALGAERVEAVMMPSRYTIDMSLEDARAEAEALAVSYREIPIEKPFEAFLDILSDAFAGYTADTTEENIQARCRGLILMALSNKQGRIVLTTGNKSEMSVGYATLYGDMAGGFAPIKDVPKLLVYQLCDYRNGISAVIPQRVIERPPSAELAPDQKDEDSLPPYDVLDPILEAYIEGDRSIEDIIGMGFEEDTVRRIAGLVDRNEYKRRQSPPGVRVSQRAFGRDRRYPITSGYLKSIPL